MRVARAIGEAMRVAADSSQSREASPSLEMMMTIMLMMITMMMMMMMKMMTLIMGWLSTVPAHVISGRSLEEWCSL